MHKHNSHMYAHWGEGPKGRKRESEADFSLSTLPAEGPDLTDCNITT